jgi:AP-2 complex subunit mu-1
MISALLFINLKGEVIISRFYREDVSRTAIDAFRTRIIAAKKFGTPVVNLDKASFMYTRYGDVFVVGVSRHNCNPTLVFQFMFKMVDVLKAYFGGTFDEDNIRQNFVVIYELLDECADYGYPQLTAINILSSFIKHGQVKAGMKESDEPQKDANTITTEITGNVDWRQPDKHKYRKNEVFIDVLEAVNLLMSNKGNVLRSDVSGKIIMKTFLSGMPECKFGLNDKLVMEKESKNQQRGVRAGTGIAIDDVTFHRCVKLGQFEHDRTISFVPPDGEFELMKYRITENVNLPFKVIPVVSEHGRTRVEYEIKIKGNFSAKLLATNVIMKIPTPPNVSKTNFTVGNGKAKYNSSQNLIIWKMKKFPGDAAFSLHGEVTMIASVKEKQWSRPPITLEFQVPMFTSSGLHVRFMKVFERSNYETIKWVRYMTRAGQYQIRI